MIKISTEHQDVGRRNFNVCKHHSNRFGLVFEGERTSYMWNCASTPSPTSRQNKIFPVRVSCRHSNCPFIYE